MRLSQIHGPGARLRSKQPRTHPVSAPKPAAGTHSGRDDEYAPAKVSAPLTSPNAGNGVSGGYGLARPTGMRTEDKPAFQQLAAPRSGRERWRTELVRTQELPAPWYRLPPLLLSAHDNSASASTAAAGFCARKWSDRQLAPTRITFW